MKRLLTILTTTLLLAGMVGCEANKPVTTRTAPHGDPAVNKTFHKQKYKKSYKKYKKRKQGKKL